MNYFFFGHHAGDVFNRTVEREYFNGGKSAEEVVKVIENRVQLYLNETK